jgi:hypothetical protein
MLKVLILSLFALAQAGGSERVNLRAIFWRVSDESSKILETTRKQAVELFIFELTAEDEKSLSELKSEYLKEFPQANAHLSDIDFLHKLFTVSEFRFVDLEGDGIYELVASLDNSGRAFYNTVIVIRKRNGRFESQGITSWNPRDYSRHDFSKELVDLNGDGVKEIVAYQPMTDYEGAVNPIAFWPSVYQWSGQSYIKADEQFPEFYKTRVIPELEKEINAIRQREELEDLEKEILSSYYYLPLFKALRITGVDQKAGFNKAVSWVATGVEQLKKNAIVVFEDLADEDSIRYLESLARQRDAVISERVQRALDAIKKKRE